MIWSTIISTVDTVRWPISEPTPRPTRNPMPMSSSSHSPILTISLTGGLS